MQVFPIRIPLLGVATWLVAAAFALIFPALDSLDRSVALRLDADWLLVLAGVGAFTAWSFVPSGAPVAAERRRRRLTVDPLIALVISLVAQIGLAVAAGLAVHRDFFTLPFQAVILHIAILVETAPFQTSRFFFSFADRLYVFAVAVIALFMVWTMFMGYAISTRSEPRWIPAVGYNVENVLLCVVLYLATLGLHDRSKRELSLQDRQLFLDHLDITPLISASALPLVRHFLTAAAGHRLSCKAAQELLDYDTATCDCSKATLCPRYRFVYNRINELSRVFQALRIGRVISPSNRRAILEEGWQFVADPSVTIVARRPEN